MSYARSPRLVCSTTMGTSVVPRYSGSGSSKVFILVKVETSGARLVCLCFRRADGANSGVLREPVESFVTPQLSFHPIERTLLCQTSVNCRGGLATMAGRMFEFVIDLFVGNVDVFSGGDAIHDQFGFHVVGSAFLLAAAQGYPIDIYRSGVNALRGQGADNALQPHIHLMLNQRLWYGKVVELDQRGDDLFAEEFFVFVVALVLEAFAN